MLILNPQIHCIGLCQITNRRGEFGSFVCNLILSEAWSVAFSVFTLNMTEHYDPKKTCEPCGLIIYIYEIKTLVKTLQEMKITRYQDYQVVVTVYLIRELHIK